MVGCELAGIRLHLCGYLSRSTIDLVAPYGTKLLPDRLLWDLLVFSFHDLRIYCDLCIGSTKHEKILYLLAVVGFLYGVIWEALGENTGFVPLNYVFQTTNVLFGSSRNFIMQGIPYMTVGYVLRKKRFIRTWVWGVAVFILATLCKAAEIRLFTGVGVFQAIQAVALFELARNSRLPISDKASRILREASTSTYCIHVLFILSFDIGLQKPWYLNCGLALTISLIVYAVVKQINSRWLCEMFNIMPQKKG